MRAPPPPMLNSMLFERRLGAMSSDGCSVIGIELSTDPLKVLTLNVAPTPSGIARSMSPECDLNS